MPSLKIDTAPAVVQPEITAELVNEPCSLCGTLVQAARPEDPGLLAIEPCGCRI